MNPLKRLLELFPTSPLLTAQVLTVNADGTSTVEFPGGTTYRARGTSVAEGNRAFIRGGVIEGEAPNLPTFDAEV